ncbi:MAG: hypothetical protein PVG42_04115 [Lysobacterales bacterium]
MSNAATPEAHRETRSSRVGVMFVAGLIAATFVCALAVGSAQAQPLRFSITEGMSENLFLLDGPVAGHLVLTSGQKPRLIAALPAGNSGAGLFFQQLDEPTNWSTTAPLTAVQEPTDGLMLRGFQIDLAVDAQTLAVGRVDVGSLRFVRKAVDMGSVAERPPIVTDAGGNEVRWARGRADGKSRYVLAIEVLNGRVEPLGGDSVRFVADTGDLRLRLTALTGDAPLTPIDPGNLLMPGIAKDERLEHALRFLAYREKLLAGSWRFLTYFGRDTLLSLELLMPVLGAEAIEAGLGSVIERVNPAGEVAHEEEIGELAVLHNQKASGRAVDTPVFDYAMVDDNLMLLPVLAGYLARLDGAAARAFLGRGTADGRTYREVLALNAGLVLEAARPFAADPAPAHLVGLKPGQVHGNWRDSEEGLARGRYPYDVNVELMPAALRALAALNRRGLVEGDAEAADALAAVWQREAVKPFLVTVPAEVAPKAVSAYAQRLGVPAPPTDGAVTFAALSLDAGGRPIPVQHSDGGFGLMFGSPDRLALDRALDLIERPFPDGLMSPVGLMVANPVFADDATQAIVDRSHYHGTVVWSWQQAMWVTGLRRQQARTDLAPPLKARLRAVECRLWQAIDATADVRNSELWSWEFRDGTWRVAPFGQRAGDVTESNAVQLWSTVYLALSRPDASYCSR